MQPLLPLLSCWSWWPFCWHQEKDWPGNIAAVHFQQFQSGTDLPGGACQTSSDVWVPRHGLQAHSGGLYPIPLPGTVSEGLHNLMGYSHPLLQTCSGHKGKEQPSSSHHPPPQSHQVTKGPLIPISGEGDSTVPSRATQDLSPSKSHTEIMNPPGLRSFQAL